MPGQRHRRRRVASACLSQLRRLLHTKPALQWPHAGRSREPGRGARQRVDRAPSVAHPAKGMEVCRTACKSRRERQRAQAVSPTPFAQQLARRDQGRERLVSPATRRERLLSLAMWRERLVSPATQRERGCLQHKESGWYRPQRVNAGNKKTRGLESNFLHIGRKRVSASSTE